MKNCSLTVSRAGNDRPELVERPGGDPGGLGHAVLAAADLPGGLVEPGLHVLLPVLVEVPIGDDVVSFRRHSTICNIVEMFKHEIYTTNAISSKFRYM